jgi:hypothetical protein
VDAPQRPHAASAYPRHSHGRRRYVCTLCVWEATCGCAFVMKYIPVSPWQEGEHSLSLSFPSVFFLEERESVCVWKERESV